MMTIETAADRGKWDVAVYAAKQMLVPLRTLHEIGEWTDDDLQLFLKRRGLVKQVNDETYREWLEKNMPMF